MLWNFEITESGLNLAWKILKVLSCWPKPNASLWSWFALTDVPTPRRR